MLHQHERIRMLNDRLRIYHIGGKVVVTGGIAALPGDTIMAIELAIATFENFNSQNDPHDEHDFGVLEIRGHTILFKIDYFDFDLGSMSPDPSDPAVTRRIMTVMLAEEY